MRRADSHPGVRLPGIRPRLPHRAGAAAPAVLARRSVEARGARNYALMTRSVDAVACPARLRRAASTDTISVSARASSQYTTQVPSRACSTRRQGATAGNAARRLRGSGRAVRRAILLCAAPAPVARPAPPGARARTPWPRRLAPSGPQGRRWCVTQRRVHD